MLVLLLIAAAWQPVIDEDGIVVEARSVSDSSWEELRAIGETKAPPEVLIDVIWGMSSLADKPPNVKLRRVVREGRDEKVLYEQLEVPMISNRDYTIWNRRLADAQTRVYQVLYDTKNEWGPPPASGFVRMPLIRGSVTVEPSASGGSVVTYIVLGDPGGALPAWIGKRASRKAALEWMQHKFKLAAVKAR